MSASIAEIAAQLQDFEPKRLRTTRFNDSSVSERW